MKGAFHIELKEIIESLEEQAELLRSPQEKALMEAARMLKESNGNVWYDAEKDAPKYFEVCIIRCNASPIAEGCMALRTEGGWHWWNGDGVAGDVIGIVTHWMPRPKAPK